MLNKKVRKDIYSNVKQIESIFSLSETCGFIYGNMILEDYYNYENKEEFIKTYIKISIMFSDLFKILNEKRKNNMLNKKEEDLFYAMNEISELDEFMKLSNEFLDLGQFLVTSTTNFCDMNVFGKIYLHKLLNEEQIVFLKKICPTFEEDLSSYNQKFDLNAYLTFYKKYLHHFEKSGFNNIKNRFDCIEPIENYFEKLLFVDIDNGDSEVFNELVSFFIDMNNFLDKNGYRKLEVEIDLEDYLERHIYDKDFIKLAIDFYIGIKNSEQNGIYTVDDLSFSDEEFEEFRSKENKTKFKNM